MRLIDADAFKRYCKEGLKDILPEFASEKYKQLAIKLTEDFCRDIDEQPTIEAIPVQILHLTSEELKRSGDYYQEFSATVIDSVIRGFKESEE